MTRAQTTKVAVSASQASTVRSGRLFNAAAELREISRTLTYTQAGGTNAQSRPTCCFSCSTAALRARVSAAPVPYIRKVYTVPVATSMRVVSVSLRIHMGSRSRVPVACPKRRDSGLACREVRAACHRGLHVLPSTHHPQPPNSWRSDDP